MDCVFQASLCSETLSQEGKKMFTRHTHVADGTENCLYAHQGKTKVSFDEKSQWQQPKLTLDKCGADTRAINGNKGPQSKTRIMKLRGLLPHSPPQLPSMPLFLRICCQGTLSGQFWSLGEDG